MTLEQLRQGAIRNWLAIPFAHWHRGLHAWIEWSSRKWVATMDYIAGERRRVDADLRRAGFSRIGESMYQKGDRRIRWVSGREQIIGIEGNGRKFILRDPWDGDIKQEAIVRRFSVTTKIED